MDDNDDTLCPGDNNDEDMEYKYIVMKRFIKLYEELPELWDSSHENYTNIWRRKAALDKLLVVYKELKPDANRNDVRKKINSLRSNFRRELRRCQSNKLNEVHRSSWAFGALQFLRNAKNYEENQDHEVNTISFVVRPNATKRVDSRKKKNSLKTGIKCIVQSCKKSRRHCENLKMFQFPTVDKPLGLRWRKKCNIPMEDYNKNMFICENHFERKCIGKRYLRTDAIPTLQLDDHKQSSDNDADADVSTSNQMCRNHTDNLDCGDCETQIKLTNLYRKKYKCILKKHLAVMKRNDQRTSVLGGQKMPDKLQVDRFIAEVKKRPALWDERHAGYRNRVGRDQQWQEIADIMKATNLQQCKRKWRNLFDNYRAEVELVKYLREAHNKVEATSKWVHFEAMNFINESKDYSPIAIAEATPITTVPTIAAATTVTTTIASDVAVHSDGAQEAVSFYSQYYDIKDEPIIISDDENENSLIYEEFKSVTATPQTVQRCLSEAVATTSEATTRRSDCQRRAYDQVTNESKRPKYSSPIAIPVMTAAPTSSTTIIAATVAVPSNVSQESASFNSCLDIKDEPPITIDDDNKEFQSLATPNTVRRLSESNSRVNPQQESAIAIAEISSNPANNHAGSANYNFLISFLPQMDKMSELQNFQFRAKMSEVFLNILSPTTTTTTTTTTNTTDATITTTSHNDRY